MNRIFMAVATVFSSGVFAYAYLKAWVSIKYFSASLPLKTGNEIDYPYFHRDEEIYLRVTLIFGLIFFFLWLASLFFTIKKKWGRVFLIFVLSMMTILAVMVNGAIK